MTTEYVILVDEADKENGVAEKLEAHQKGLLHRALSVFIFNSENELLLQKRAAGKYHSAGLWTNTCCSHPRPGESTDKAAERRLMEEMGLETPIRFAYSFRYHALFGNGLTEHELDHVYIGFSDRVPVLNAQEASDWKYADEEFLKRDITENPDHYTEWVKLCIPRVFDELRKLRS